MPMNFQFQPPLFGAGEMVAFLIHAFLMLVAGVGIILLIVWMVKNLKAKRLLTWAIILTALGLLGSAVTFGSEMDTISKFVWGGAVRHSGSYVQGNGQYQSGMMKMDTDMMKTTQQ